MYIVSIQLCILLYVDVFKIRTQIISFIRIIIKLSINNYLFICLFFVCSAVLACMLVHIWHILLLSSLVSGDENLHVLAPYYDDDTDQSYTHSPQFNATYSQTPLEYELTIHVRTCNNLIGCNVLCNTHMQQRYWQTLASELGNGSLVLQLEYQGKTMLFALFVGDLVILPVGNTTIPTAESWTGL